MCGGQPSPVHVLAQRVRLPEHVGHDPFVGGQVWPDWQVATIGSHVGHDVRGGPAHTLVEVQDGLPEHVGYSRHDPRSAHLGGGFARITRRLPSACTGWSARPGA